ncbi:MAG: type II toxin-antitoxin system VapC family toxin [Acidimicrobiaceae bacterium]|nr:type II toxin-antitoxin system VapC family toxin [Acidimicrobiaceae bacterium]MDE0498503.1 type II toxin-antitoxin system VapC family toxin [Acidimicrobiaceae bacterium]
MIVLDTNVISEVMRERPDTGVLAWIDDQPAGELCVTAITEAEIRTGIAILPDGSRKLGLVDAVERAFGTLFAGRVLPFDSNAAQAYAQIAADRRARGRPISQADCQIAATARSIRASLATRNVSDFDGCGIDVINPWNADA